MTARLNINIDHVATVRQARRAPEPNLIAAAMACEQAGADGITVHLRGDRRHIQDLDIRLLRDSIITYLNLEMAATDEMLDIALQTGPDAVTLVAERPNEITTEGGLDVQANVAVVKAAVDRLREASILPSLFIDPDPAQIEVAHQIGAQQVELCTAAYAEATLGARGIHGEGAARAARELQRLKEGAELALRKGLNVAAGHGLTYRNVGALARISEITEFNIGHNIIARAIFVGLETAVREMRAAMSQSTEDSV
ncbi:MAG TPA: pyridoxine 5'-phosphate synthase [Pyrinomonadaceae bacterium]|nr:pyridoxine 5'-phosphate synthase [Pyrinomonadaceae bacterium]